ncbi:MAG: hypothetical protein AB7J32_00325 [Pseudonocardia sp.]
MGEREKAFAPSARVLAVTSLSHQLRNRRETASHLRELLTAVDAAQQAVARAGKACEALARAVDRLT